MKKIMKKFICVMLAAMCILLLPGCTYLDELRDKQAFWDEESGGIIYKDMLYLPADNSGGVCETTYLENSDYKNSYSLSDDSYLLITDKDDSVLLSYVHGMDAQIDNTKSVIRTNDGNLFIREDCYEAFFTREDCYEENEKELKQLDEGTSNLYVAVCRFYSFDQYSEVSYSNVDEDYLDLSEEDVKQFQEILIKYDKGFPSRFSYGEHFIRKGLSVYLAEENHNLGMLKYEIEVYYLTENEVDYVIVYEKDTDKRYRLDPQYMPDWVLNYPEVVVNFYSLYD